MPPFFVTKKLSKIKCNLDHVIGDEIVAVELESLLTFIGDEETLSMIMLSHACLPFITPSNAPNEHIKSTYVDVIHVSF